MLTLLKFYLEAFVVSKINFCSGSSRLSRRLVFRKYLSVSPRKDEEYYELKARNVEYASAFTALKNELLSLGVGKWISNGYQQIYA